MPVTITRQIHVQNIERLGASPGVVRYMTARGVQVQSAARERLRESPRRIDTGTLINSIQVEVRVVGTIVIVRIGTNVEYAIFVHDGTRFMAANPFLADAVRRVFG
jgi:hypothetical protein